MIVLVKLDMHAPPAPPAPPATGIGMGVGMGRGIGMPGSEYARPQNPP